MINLSMLLTAREAAQRLGVKLDTVYAYVSRGRLRSVAVPGSRQRRYRVEEVEALRGAALPMPYPAEAEALTPVIASSICLIENGRVYYRGEDAIALSYTATLEDVAELLWQARPADSSTPATAPPGRSGSDHRVYRALPHPPGGARRSRSDGARSHSPRCDPHGPADRA